MGAAACLVGTGFCSCEHRTVAVILLSLSMTFMGLGRGGFMVNFVDFAPAYVDFVLHMELSSVVV